MDNFSKIKEIKNHVQIFYFCSNNNSNINNNINIINFFFEKLIF